MADLYVVLINIVLKEFVWPCINKDTVNFNQYNFQHRQFANFLRMVLRWHGFSARSSTINKLTVQIKTTLRINTSVDEYLFLKMIGIYINLFLIFNISTAISFFHHKF